MSVEVAPGPIHVGVDLIDSRAGTDDDPTHLFPAEWEEFVAAIKSGRYDNPASSVVIRYCRSQTMVPGV
jgi:hypothetical protein